MTVTSSTAGDYCPRCCPALWPALQHLAHQHPPAAMPTRSSAPSQMPALGPCGTPGKSPQPTGGEECQPTSRAASQRANL